MNCNRCGSIFPDGQTKCPQCGEAINNFGVVPTKKMINLLGIVAAIITAISVFLPAVYIKIENFSDSASLIKGYGTYIIVATVVYLILIVLKKDKAAQSLALMLTVFMIYQYFNETQGLKEYKEYGATVGLSIGFYLCLFGTIVMFIAPFVWNKLQSNK